MRLDITVDLGRYAEGRLAVSVAVSAADRPYSFALAALEPASGLSVSDWRAENGEHNLSGGRFTVQGDAFNLSYIVGVPWRDCLGSGKDIDLIYPFINDSEIFFGTGLLPIPADPCEVSFRLIGLPPGWTEFSSLSPGGMHLQKLPAFFCYCALGLRPVEHIRRGKENDVIFRVLPQRGKSLPMSERDLCSFFDGYMDRLERDLIPYRRAREINFLVLQPPADFEAIADGRTFASGENVLNGVACYGPEDMGYIRKRFGYSTYARFLYEGLAHELMHFYTSGASDVPEKTVLYPGLDCPKYSVRLIAEALNLYFCSQYASELVPEARGSFESWLERCRAIKERTGAPQPLLELRELDEHLRSKGNSLLELFREMLLIKEKDRRPYGSAAFLFDTMRVRLGIESPSALEKAILSRP